LEKAGDVIDRLHKQEVIEHEQELKELDDLLDTV